MEEAWLDIMPSASPPSAVLLSFASHLEPSANKSALGLTAQLLQDLSSSSSSSSTNTPKSASSSSLLGSITGSAKWDVFAVYIVLCVIVVALCCLSVVLMFWCCPARSSEAHRGGSAAAQAGIYLGGSPTRTPHTNIILLNSSSSRKFTDLEEQTEESSNKT